MLYPSRFPVPKAGGSNPPERTRPQTAKSGSSGDRGRFRAGHNETGVSRPVPLLAVKWRKIGALAVKWRQAACLFAFALLLPSLASGQPVRTYEVLGGNASADSLRAGTMLTVTRWRVSNTDTVKVWAERTTTDTGPSRHRAQSADVVIWCYPGHYPDARHLFPEARVVVSFSRTHGKRRLITFTSEATYEKHYANELGPEPLALH